MINKKIGKSYLSKVRRLDEVPSFMKKAVAVVKYQERVNSLKAKGAIPFTEIGFEKVSWDLYKKNEEPDFGSIWVVTTIKNANDEDEKWLVVNVDDNDKILRNVKASITKKAIIPGDSAMYEYEPGKFQQVFVAGIESRDSETGENTFKVRPMWGGGEEHFIVEEKKLKSASLEKKAQDYYDTRSEDMPYFKMYDEVTISDEGSPYYGQVGEVVRTDLGAGVWLYTIKFPDGTKENFKEENIEKTSSKKTSHTPGAIVQVVIPQGGINEKYNGKVGEVVAAVPDRSKISFKDMPSLWFEDNTIRVVASCNVCGSDISLQSLKKLGKVECRCGAFYSRRQLERIAKTAAVNERASKKTAQDEPKFKIDDSVSISYADTDVPGDFFEAKIVDIESYDKLANEWVYRVKWEEEGEDVYDVAHESTLIKISSIKKAKIVEKGNEYCVIAESGRSMGCYPSRKKAEERLKQVEMFKHMKGKKAQTERPAFARDEHLEYLDGLRESGVTNMWGASPYLEEEFPDDFMNEKEAGKVLTYWMKTFSERHKESKKAQEEIGDVWKLETPEEEEAVMQLNLVIEHAFGDPPEDVALAQEYLEEVFEESWERVKEKLETEGSVWYVWFMDGVHKFMEMNKELFTGETEKESSIKKKGQNVIFWFDDPKALKNLRYLQGPPTSPAGEEESLERPELEEVELEPKEVEKETKVSAQSRIRELIREAESVSDEGLSSAEKQALKIIDKNHPDKTIGEIVTALFEVQIEMGDYELDDPEALAIETGMFLEQEKEASKKTLRVKKSVRNFEVGDSVQIMDKEGNTNVVPKATIAQVDEYLGTDGQMHETVEVTGSANEDEQTWYGEEEYQVVLLDPIEASKKKKIKVSTEIKKEAKEKIGGIVKEGLEKKAQSFQKGDWVTYRTDYGFQSATVKSINLEENYVTVELPDGDIVNVPLSELHKLSSKKTSLIKKKAQEEPSEEALRRHFRSVERTEVEHEGAKQVLKEVAKEDYDVDLSNEVADGLAWKAVRIDPESMTDDMFNALYGYIRQSYPEKIASIKKKAQGGGQFEMLRGGGGGSQDQLIPMGWNVQESKTPELPEQTEEIEEIGEEIVIRVNPEDKSVQIDFEGEKEEEVEKPVGAETPPEKPIEKPRGEEGPEEEGLEEVPVNF